MWVKILSTVETSYQANPQQIELMELEGYSWPTCSKQPRLVDCRIGVVNKLDRRRVLLTTRSTCHGSVPSFWRHLNFLLTLCAINESKDPCQKPARFVQSFRHNTGLWRSDGRIHDDGKYRASIASCGKNCYRCISFNMPFIIIIIIMGV